MCDVFCFFVGYGIYLVFFEVDVMDVVVGSEFEVFVVVYFCCYLVGEFVYCG